MWYWAFLDTLPPPPRPPAVGARRGTSSVGRPSGRVCEPLGECSIFELLGRESCCCAAAVALVVLVRFLFVAGITNDLGVAEF